MARLTIADLKDVREAVFDGQNSWYDIGVELDVSPATLDNIKTQFHDDADCLREMLKVWLKGLDCSWKVIVAALKSKALRQKTGTLAAEIEKEYCTETAASKGAVSATGNSQEGVVSELQTKVRKLESEVSALRTQKKLDQADFASATEPSFQSGIDISAKPSFIVTSDKEHLFEMKGFGLRLHILEGSLPPGVTETELHVQASLSGKYCLPEGSELASAVYWLSVPVKISRPVTVEIQHNAVFEDSSSNLSFAICRCPEGRQPLLSCTFEKLEGGMFIRSSHNGSISLSSFSGLAIIMPKGSPQHYLSQLWYAKKSERDFSAYYVITKDLAALKSAVQACYSDEAYQGCCERIDFEGDQVVMDIPMEGIRTGKWQITPVCCPVIQKEEAHSRRLPVCELAIHYDGIYASDMPPRFTYAINLLGAKGTGYVVLDIKKLAFEVYQLKLFYHILDDNSCDVYCAVGRDLSDLSERLVMELGAVEGPEMTFIFESHTVSIETPAAVSGWRIEPQMTEFQISQEGAKNHAQCQFRVIRDPNTQEPLSMDLLLKGARPHDKVIRVFLDPSVWGTQKSSAIHAQQQKIQKKETSEQKSRLYHLEHLLMKLEGRDLERPGKSRSILQLLSDSGIMESSAERETELSRIKSDTEKLIGITKKRETELSRIKSDTEELIRRTQGTPYPRIHHHLPLSTAKSSKSLHHTLRRSLSTPDMRHSRCLSGMDVIGETTLSVTNEVQTFHWAGYGLKLHIPPASLPAGVKKSSIEIKASLAGPFNFPEDATLVSAVYCLQSSVEFSQPIAVQIQHCGIPSDDHSLTFARASMKEPPYVFTALEGGLFPPDSAYANIQLDRFSRLAIFQVFQQLWNWLTSGEPETSHEQEIPHEPERRYCAHVYYTKKETVNTWRVHFVVTHNLEAYVTVVSERYSGAVAGPVWDVIFEGEEIVLDFQEPVNDNWTITPLAYPKVAKKLVDTIESGGRLPSCQLLVKWKGNGTPDDLEYKVALKGAKEPSNFFIIALECEGTTKDVSPIAQRISRLERAGQVPGPSTSLIPSPSRDLAPRYTAGLESEPELSDLMDQIASRIPNKWRAVGIALGLTINELDCFSRYEDPSHCFSVVFTFWKSRMTREPYSWGTMVQTLRAPSVGELKMAEQLENRLTNQN